MYVTHTYPCPNEVPSTCSGYPHTQHHSVEQKQYKEFVVGPTNTVVNPVGAQEK